MARIRFDGVSKRYGDVVAVRSLNLEIRDKEFVVLLGPSGCGKSTTLNVIAGLEEASEGELWFDNEMVNRIPPHHRDVAMVFQSYALYPHKTVYENIAFGLRMRRIAPAEVDRRVQDAAKKLEIANLLSRRPSQLSGGQRLVSAQRGGTVMIIDLIIWLGHRRGSGLARRPTRQGLRFWTCG